MPISDYELHQLRADRGKRLSSQVTQHKNGFYVRSQSGSAKIYNVKIEGGQWRCSCDEVWHGTRNAVYRGDEGESSEENEKGSKEEIVHDWIYSVLR